MFYRGRHICIKNIYTVLIISTLWTTTIDAWNYFTFPKNLYHDFFFFSGSEVELNKKLALNTLWKRTCHSAAISCVFALCLYYQYEYPGLMQCSCVSLLFPRLLIYCWSVRGMNLLGFVCGYWAHNNLIRIVSAERYLEECQGRTRHLRNLHLSGGCCLPTK